MDLAVWLNPEHEAYCRAVAWARQTDAERRGMTDRHGTWNKEYGFELHLAGARAEQAAAIAYGVRWIPQPVERRHDPDVGWFDVRSTTYRAGGLLLHEDDPDQRPVVLVTGGTPLRIVGWIFGAEGKVRGYWWGDARVPCYRVPQTDLRAPETLRRS